MVELVLELKLTDDQKTQTNVMLFATHAKNLPMALFHREVDFIAQNY